MQALHRIHSIWKPKATEKNGKGFELETYIVCHEKVLKEPIDFFASQY